MAISDVFCQIGYCCIAGDTLDIYALSGGNCFPHIEEFFVGEVIAKDNSVDMDVPIARATGSFDNITAANNGIAPIDALAESSEGTDNLVSSFLCVGAIRDGESEVFHRLPGLFANS